MASSCRVQSALRVTTVASWKAFWTEGCSRAIRSLTWQLRHQAAVKSTKTGCPCAAAHVTSLADQEVQCPTEAFSRCANISGVIFKLRWRVVGTPFTKWRPAYVESIATDANIRPARPVDQRLAGHRPRNHPATASRRKLESKAGSMSA